MKPVVVLAVAALALSGCGTTREERALSGAMIGGGVGLVSGGVGVLVGAVVGGGAGFVMSPEQINLGRPIWK